MFEILSENDLCNYYDIETTPGITPVAVVLCPLILRLTFPALSVTVVPVISSNTGGIPEVNIDGYSGYTAEVGDVETMGRKAVQLLQNDELFHQFKRQARKQAENFSIDIIGPKYISIYKMAQEKVLAEV
mgnify:CR=1 FL=1